MIQLAPSILAADFSRLGEEVRETEEAGADRIHIDVMDGHFVPNLSMGPAVVKSLRPVTALPFEVHLMVEHPAKFLEAFVKAGADLLIVHYEALLDPRPVLEAVRRMGKRVGLAANPDTPVDALKPYLTEIDLALCMTVHPGFAGQRFVPSSPERIAKLRRLIDQDNPRCELEVDGGIREETAVIAVESGANVLAMASALFGAPDGPGAALRRIRALVEQV